MIFAYIYSAVKKILFLVFLNDYIKHTHPEKYQQIIVNVTFKAIYIYSKIQLLYVKLCNNIKKVVDNNPNLKMCIDRFNNMKLIENQKTDIEYIQNGEIIKTNRNTIISSSDFFKENDMAIFLDFENSLNDCVNKKIISSIPNNWVCESASIRFILIELVLDNSCYKINLKDNDYNYYVVDNIISQKFIMYYIMKHYSNNTEIFNEINLSKKMVLKIIDHNVNMIEIDIRETNKGLILKKYDYSII